MEMETHGVTVRSIKVLRGPNLYAYMPVLKIIMDIGPYEDRPSNSFPGFVERITAWLPGLQKHQCSVGKPGGFIERLQRGTYLGHISEHITLELQNMLGFPVAFGRARGTGEPGVYNVVIAYREEEPAWAAFETALRLTLAAMHDEPFDIEAEMERLHAIADEFRLGPSTAAIVAAAKARKIPVLRLTPTGSLVQLGYGVYQKRIQASETSNTSAIAVDMCQEKPLTNRMLRMVGVPVPDGRPVDSAEEAWEVAQEIGLPVVVKPEAGNQGKGVSVNLNSEEEVRAAYDIADNYRGGVLVEKYIVGNDYRLLVVNGEMVAASRRDPAMVMGNGVHTIRELVEEVNKDPRRRPGHSSTLTRIRLDAAAELVLSQQGLSLDSVPPEGKVVKLRQNCNLSTGGTATDVTEEVHPSNARLAELAAQILALDIAGIDVLCQDITRPLSEQGGAIVEVNAAPGLRMHLHPAYGTPRDVGVPIVRMLYPEGAPARIPIIAITGTNGKTTVTRLVSHMYETARWKVGMTCTEGTFIDKERILEGDCSGPKSAQTVLLHPRVEVAVLETARGGILREGLAFDRCSVGVVTNISADHLGQGGINSLEELARVKQVVIEAVANDGSAILNADDRMVAEMAAATDARVVYFSMNPNNHIIKAHLAEDDGWCVFVEDGMIVLAKGEERVELVELERVPFTLGGKIRFQVQNALAATAAAWAAGLNPAMIVRALTTFKADSTMTPGRFNVNELNGVQIILDYGHNAAAMKALMEAVEAYGKRRTVMVIGLPGDRRDQDITSTFEATLPHVDEYFLHDLGDRREREKNEVPHLMQSLIPEAVPSTIVADQQEAVMQAWKRLKPGDRLVVIADIVDDTLEVLNNLAHSVEEDAACEVPLSSMQEDSEEREKSGSSSGGYQYRTNQVYQRHQPYRARRGIR
ncbi:MAG TPA: cyanophycin synthetase [Chloroflexia bacterium]|nr:cyanophycin synthetase [Chloroflexia bacterium]